MDGPEYEKNIRARIYQLMRELPVDKVTTYGDLAAMAGSPRGARIVGGIAHYGNPDLPWHRLVNRFGGLASGFHGGRDVQAQLLEREGITCTNFIVDDFEELRWKPSL